VGAFGERLKREREKRKITLEEVALATKIGTRYLRAIEQEDFDKLPGGIFNKGFVKAYARHLGLNGNEAVADYEKAFRATHPEELTPVDPDADSRKIMELRAIRVQQERPRIELIPWGKAAVALLVFAFALAVWGSYAHFTKPAEEQAAVEQAANSPQESPTSVSPEPSPKLAEPRPVEQKSNAPAPKQTPTPEAIPSQAQPSNPDAAETFRVAIHAREDSWVHINADGKDVLEDTLPAESQKSVRAANQLVIKAGNIGALDFWFNGQKLPVQGHLDQVKTVTFDSAGLVAPVPKAQSIPTAVER
jgi:cytoskeleton protein RodZ